MVKNATLLRTMQSLAVSLSLIGLSVVSWGFSGNDAEDTFAYLFRQPVSSNGMRLSWA